MADVEMPGNAQEETDICSTARSGDTMVPRTGRVKKLVNGFVMHLDLDDGGISRALYERGCRERAFMSILEESISEGMTCLDIGANIGYATLHMARGAGRAGIVYAVEPDPHNLQLLAANIGENGFEGRCTTIRGLISDRDGEMELWLSDQPNLHSVAKTKHSRRRITVPAYSLGSFLDNYGFANFVKMDVEGHEVKILEGALDYFAGHRGRIGILVEVHPHLYDSENDFGAIVREYFRLGFYPRYVVSTPVPRPRLFKEAGYHPVRTVHTDGVVRGIYENVRNEDLIRLACRENIEGDALKIARSFLLVRDC